jgi:hypothetical protein
MTVEGETITVRVPFRNRRRGGRKVVRQVDEPEIQRAGCIDIDRPSYEIARRPHSTLLPGQRPLVAAAVITPYAP